MKLHKNTLMLGIAAFVITCTTFALTSGRASAATLAVDSGCTLPEAIAAVNAAQDGNGCIKTGAVYGTADTINLPNGTTTLAADLTAIQKPLVIAGVGKTTTVLDANGHRAFRSDYAGQDFVYNLTIKDMSIKDATEAAIDAQNSQSVTLQNLDISNSERGVNIKATVVTVTGCIIHNNNLPSNSTDSANGLSMKLTGNDVADIPTAMITDTIVKDNTTNDLNDFSGIAVNSDETVVGSSSNFQSISVTLQRVTITGNKSKFEAGLYVLTSSGPVTTVPTSLLVDATTIANNTVDFDTAQPVSPGLAHPPVMAGFFITGKLASQQNFTNVTVANNSIKMPAGDNRNGLAGFFGSVNYDGAPLRITNTTVVGNSVTQPESVTAFSSFTVVRVKLDFSNFPTIAVVAATSGSSSENGLVAHNLRNGQPQSCSNSIDLAPLGLTGTVDVTPLNLGHNLSDDQTCSGFIYAPNLYDTIDHDIANNGGPVPTIAIHNDSPAVNAGGKVLGITTDARGVERVGYYSVGAYQGKLLAAATTDGKLAETGVVMISVGLLAAILLTALLYTYIDYRHHRKPIAQADVGAAIPYTFSHHVRVVTIPLLRYRLSITLKKKPSTITKF